MNLKILKFTLISEEEEEPNAADDTVVLLGKGASRGTASSVALTVPEIASQSGGSTP